MDISIGFSGVSGRLRDSRNWVDADETYYRSDALSLWDVFLARYNVDCVSLLLEAGISPLALNNRNLFISWPRYCRFLELAAIRCGDVNLGIEHSLFMPNDFPNTGPLMLLARLCGTLGEWIEMGSRYAAVHTNSWVPHLFTDAEGNAVFRISENPSHKMPRQAGEGMLLILLRVVREITERPDLNPKLVRFHHLAPLDTSLHSQAFGCSVEFGAEHNEFVFDADYLDLPLSGNLSVFRGVVDIFIKREIRRAASRYDQFSVAVAHTIPAVLGTDFLMAPKIADALGVSEKKMQRLLREEGTCFQKIASDVRRDVAVKLLQNSDMPLKVIGAYLGYGSSAAFTQAFTQWEGTSPSGYRKKYRSAGRVLSDLDLYSERSLISM